MSEKLTLAVTTIGDLLLRDKITRNESESLIEDINLAIPDYQRPYKWTARNVIQLLDDIIEAKNANKEIYRIGTLILNQSKESTRYDIVDGQQRIITLSLLLNVLGEEPNFLKQKLTDNPHNRNNIPNNFRTLKRRIDNVTDSQSTDGLAKYIKENCELIVIITSDISEAFQFFDSQNSRGKKLYPHDLLKAYHLREMNSLPLPETEKIIKTWEDLDQAQLSSLFGHYLYRLKEWMKGNRADELTEHNIHKFKGITRQDNFPYAQFYKGAYAYATAANQTDMLFVSGAENLKPFQLDSLIVAGKPFFDYAKHYFDILKDIQDNNQYEGFFINDNPIVKTLETHYKNGTGNRITRLLFDTAVLLYVDRFCPEKPAKNSLDMLNQFIVFAFIWAYSLRHQYKRLGWATAQTYISGNSEKLNSFNIYKTIAEAESPTSLLGTLADCLYTLPPTPDIDADKDGIFVNYLHWFKEYNFMEPANEK